MIFLAPKHWRISFKQRVNPCIIHALKVRAFQIIFNWSVPKNFTFLKHFAVEFGSNSNFLQADTSPKIFPKSISYFRAFIWPKTINAERANIIITLLLYFCFVRLSNKDQRLLNAWDDFVSCLVGERIHRSDNWSVLKKILNLKTCYSLIKKRS